MRPQTRVLIVTALLALGGFAVLGMMADRYTRLLGDRRAPRPAVPVISPHPGELAIVGEDRRDLERFVAVRSAIREALRGATQARPLQPAETGPIVSEARRQALERVGLDYGRYATLRARFRIWMQHRDADASLESDLARQLRQADLGAFEALDQ